MQTDAKRLQQILKNLLSNAFKFTEQGRVSLRDRAGRRRLVERQRVAQPGHARSSRSASATPASASRRRSSRSSSRRSSRRTARPAASTAARAWAWRSAASSRGCSAARSGSAQHAGRGQHVHALPAADVHAGRRPPRRQIAAGVDPAAPTAHGVAGAGRCPPQQHRTPQEPSLAQPRSPTTRPTSSPGDNVAADRRERQQLRPLPLRHGARARLQGGRRRRAAPPPSRMARELQPAAITLDINLPDIDGWRVLDRLKDDPTTRHIPVQIITTDEETRARPAHGRDGRAHQADQDARRRSTRRSPGSRRSSQPRTRKLLVVDRRRGAARRSSAS